MVDSILFDKAVNVMRKALDISSERNRIITSNVANVDTIGFKPTDMDFKQSLLRALETPSESTMARTHAKHFMNGAGTALPGDPVCHERSVAAVDIDQEMTNLAENNIQYRTNSEMLMRKLSLIKFSITEGGR
jgi:flagellar basal-body rod protein FlgB